MSTRTFYLLRNDNKLEFTIGFLCLITYSGTLFFPLLDKDAAHHANIALHMYQSGDYISLVDRGRDYLDKPHFLFWTTLLFFKLFGINTVAHRLPALLFALLTVYCTYKLSRRLTDKTNARLAAIVIATAQAFILSVSDARMETPLSAGMILGLWQLIIYIDKSKFINLLFGVLGIAMAFSTKGWLGPVIVFIALFVYIFLNRKWHIFTQFKTWLFIPLFFAFISPVLYAYYVQYDLHPEKVIRGRNHISGVKFILWGQLFERYKGFDEGGRFSDPFYLYHTFLWAFMPWCVVAYIAVIYWFRRMFWLKKWKHPVNFSVLSFVFVLVSLSFSKFKMPHYLIMLFPLTTIFTAPYLRHILSFKKGIKLFLPVQSLFIVFFILSAIALNFYFFKPISSVIYLYSAILLGFLLWLIQNRSLYLGIKLIYLSAIASLFFNFLLYYNFFPQLLTYQGGNEMVKQLIAKKIHIRDNEIQLLDDNAHSFDFYSGYIHPTMTIERLQKDSSITKNIYILFNKKQRDELQKLGFRIEPVVIQKDYNVAMINLEFLNPGTRIKKLDTLTLAKIYKE